MSSKPAAYAAFPTLLATAAYDLAALYRRDPDQALAIAEASGRAHDAEVLRNRRREERDRDGFRGTEHPPRDRDSRRL